MRIGLRIRNNIVVIQSTANPATKRSYFAANLFHPPKPRLSWPCRHAEGQKRNSQMPVTSPGLSEQLGQLLQNPPAPRKPSYA